MTIADIDIDIAHLVPERSARSLPAATADQLLAAGLFSLLVPQSLGGLELDPLAAAAVVESTARVDGSLGWSVMIGSQSAWIASHLPATIAADVVRRPVAGVLKPGGTATRADEGYVVTGRWGMASGITYAEHVYASCLGDDGLVIAFVPATAVVVEDTWRTNGLRSTGSNDFRLHDVVVPHDLVLPFPGLGAGGADGPLYRDRWWNLVFVLQAAQALGTARGAFDEFAEIAGRTTRLGATSSLREQPTVQAAVARAEASVRSARAWLHDVTGSCWETVEAGAPPSDEQRTLLRLAITHAIRAASDAVTLLHDAAGAGAIHDDGPLHRRFQDLRAASAHVQATPGMFELAGARLLGAGATPLPSFL